MGNLQDGGVDWRDLVFTNNDAEIRRYLLSPGDVLFNRTNTIDLVGKTAIYKGEQLAIFAGYLIRIIENKSLLDSRFLNYVLNAEFSKKYSLKILSVAVGQANINGKKLKTYPVPIPPTLTEQQTIAEALSDADALIESLVPLLTKKRQIKQGVMQALLTGQTRLTGFYGAWEHNQLKQIVQTPITDGPHLTPKFQGDGVPFLSVNNLVNNRIDFSDLRFISTADHEVFSKKCRPRKGDILLGKAASVGKVALVESDIDFNIWSPIAMIRVSSSYCSRFIYYQLQSMSLVRQIALLTNSSSQGNIGMGDIEKLVVGCPQYDEQIAISTIISAHDDEIEVLEAKLQKARHLKQGMMQELLTGRIRLV
jgi:type I restriction enzyme S subunit